VVGGAGTEQLLEQSCELGPLPLRERVEELGEGRAPGDEQLVEDGSRRRGRP
jgi:hypothetical protein